MIFTKTSPGLIQPSVELELVWTRNGGYKL